MSKDNGHSQVDRREFLKAGAFLAGTALLTHRVPDVLTRLRHVDGGGHSVSEVYKTLTQPESIIYTACLGCHTSCGAKAKILDGIIAKLDGNPYSAHNMLPQPPYETSPWDLARVDGKFCPKGQTMIQTVYDPYRLRTVLKRTGKRGEGKWKTIPFSQAIDEIVNGGYLFKDVPGEENRKVEGLKDLWKLRDADLAKNMAADVKNIVTKKMTVAQFQAKYADHLDVLVDPDHPDLGPVNNQVVFMGGRIQYGREAFMKRWLNGGFGSNNYHNH